MKTFRDYSKIIEPLDKVHLGKVKVRSDSSLLKWGAFFLKKRYNCCDGIFCCDGRKLLWGETGTRSILVLLARDKKAREPTGEELESIVYPPVKNHPPRVEFWIWSEEDARFIHKFL